MARRTGTHDRSRAYTLTEVAIALLVIGMVLGGLWVVVDKVTTGSRVAKVAEQIMTVAQNIRAYYGPRGVINPCPGGTNLTAQVDAAVRQIIPNEMRSNPAVANSPLNHAMGSIVAGNSNTGSFRVSCTNAGRGFEIQALTLRREACMRLLMTFPVLSVELGVTSMRGQAGAAIAIDARNIANPGGGVALPLTPAVASARCPNATNNGVRFGFALAN